ncbi:hypothetical protein EYB33_19820 [Lysinibacillus sphaericus]|uniref:hypothetical protein n=1 Tax=Lysinibacillus sphaericus TaxID=1421 RepID=UPI001E49C894|nr:hypothetical protein [Lysinibacillus sphaericus]UDK98376.1 hypothetical protein EYB33_19820 [Lysinibacillus sphaericus]
MAKNFVESHIQQGAFHTFKVEAGQVVKIGDVVEITANGKVQVAGAGSQKVVGQVYAGTVGIDGRNVGYSGDNNEVATIVVLKPFVYMLAEGAITAGDALKAGASGGVAVLNTVGGDTALNKIAMAIESGSQGQRILCLLG